MMSANEPLQRTRAAGPLSMSVGLSRIIFLLGRVATWNEPRAKTFAEVDYGNTPRG